MVVIEEPQEQHGGNALVAIAEGMVLYYKIKQHGSLFLNRLIEVLASKSLIDLPDTTLKGIVLLVSKPLASTELLLQGVDCLHRILVGSTKRLFLGGFLYGVQAVIALKANASTGGTDFVALYISNKKNKSIFSYVFIFNAMLLMIFGMMFGWEDAGYSILFQFISTKTIDTFYSSPPVQNKNEEEKKE